jgi:hypothetical protein
MGKTISMAVFNSYVKLPEGRIWTRSLTAAGVTGSDGLPAVWLAVVAPKLGTWTGTAGTMPLEIKESQVKLGYICWIWAWNRKMAKKKTRNIIYQTSSYFIYIYIFLDPCHVESQKAHLQRRKFHHRPQCIQLQESARNLFNKSCWNTLHCLVGGLEHLDYFPIILGILSSQLTNSYFSDG